MRWLARGTPPLDQDIIKKNFNTSLNFPKRIAIFIKIETFKNLLKNHLLKPTIEG